MRTGHEKIVTTTGEGRHEKANPVTRKDPDPVSIHSRRNIILDTKAYESFEYPGSSPHGKTPAKTLKFPREYSKNFPAGLLYKRSFDAVPDVFPDLKVFPAEREEGNT